MTDMPWPDRKDWFNEIAAFLGPTYWAPDTGRVMAFTKGTEQEVEFLVDELGLEAGMRVLDLGCGPGRHSLALARRGMHVVGVDLSPDFVTIAQQTPQEGDGHATFVLGDVREIEYVAEFDAVICLCQGGFGLLGGEESVDTVRRMARALKPGGRLALTAFSSYFAVTALEEGETFDAATGVLHERATLRDPDGEEREHDLWTTCFTPRELRMLAEGADLRVDGVWAVTPGKYGRNPPDVGHPEHLLVATASSGV